MKKGVLPTIAALAAIPTTAAVVYNTVPDWKSYQQTGNPANIVSSPTVAQAIGGKVDAVDGQSSGQTLILPQIINGSATGLNVNRKISLLSYGAKCDGSTDDTAAINAWLANATGIAHVELEAPAGVCVFKETIGNPSGASQSVDLHGAGSFTTTFLYAGSATNIDLLKIGEGATAQKNWSIHDFRVASSTKMTGGAALHIQGLARSSVGNITADGQEGNGNLWNGIWWDGVDFIGTWGSNFTTGQNEAMILNAKTGGLGRSDLNLIGWKLSGTDTGVIPKIGLHIAGGFGGFACGAGTDIINNARNVLIDNANKAETNRELFFGSGCFIDSSAEGAGVEINDTQSADGDLYVSFAGGWISSSKTNNIQIDSGVRGHLVYVGGTIFNAQQNGVYDLSNMAQTYTGVQFRSNGLSGSGYGLYTSNTTPVITLIGNDFSENASGTTYGVAQNAQRFGVRAGGLAIGSRVAMYPDDSGISSIVPIQTGQPVSDNPALSFSQSGGLVRHLYLGNTISNPNIHINTSASWSNDTTKCGNISGSSGCLVLYDDKSNQHFIPYW